MAAQKDLTAIASWTSDSTSVATIVSTGVATAAGFGQTTIQATVGSISGSMQLTVTNFAPSGTLTTARSNFTATLLTNGKVLIVGGKDVNGNALISAELYDPVSETFSPAANLNAARSSHTATLLNGGTVLIAGGYGSSGTAVGSSEIYDPVANTFTPEGNLVTARGAHTATLLSSGQVLVVGGYNVNSFSLGQRGDLRSSGWDVCSRRQLEHSASLPHGDIVEQWQCALPWEVSNTFAPGASLSIQSSPARKYITPLPKHFRRLAAL